MVNGCNDFTVVVKTVDIIDKKQIYGSVIMGKKMLLNIGIVLY